MNFAAPVGLLGMVLLVGSWIPQTVETIRSRKCPMNLGFIVVYVIAAILLTVYSYMRRDWIFFTLNFLAALQSSVNMVVKFMEKSAG